MHVAVMEEKKPGRFEPIGGVAIHEMATEEVWAREDHLCGYEAVDRQRGAIVYALENWDETKA